MIFQYDKNGFKSMMHQIETYFDILEKRYCNLKEEYNKLLDEKWTDKTLQEMETKLDQAINDKNRGFPISKEEEAKINTWKLKHDTEIHNNPKQYHGVSGGGYEYSFHPTGLGTIGYCICSSCKSRAIQEKGIKYWEYLKEHNGFIEFGDFG